MNKPLLFKANYIRGFLVTIHGRCERIIFYYPSLAYAFADHIQDLTSFFAEVYESIRKRNAERTLQHYDFRRELIALRFRCMIYVPLR